MRAWLMSLALVAGASDCHRSGAGTPAPSGGPTATTVHALLASAALVGRTVSVNGRCLGYSTPTVAKGAPPVTRSDWQLEDQGEAIWVTGPLPDGCTSTTPAATAGAVLAIVAEDTLPGLGGAPAVPRRYLVRK